jgi:FkbM family methyltransferase
LDPERVIEKETDVGTIWLQKDAELFTPDVLRDGYWAQEITELMRKALRPGMTFVDAGANIGYFSVLGSKLVGPKGRVFCVEPDPMNLEILHANLERNSCGNSTVLPVAAWSERASLNLFTPESGGAGSHVGGTDGDGRVEAVPLDELVEGRVDYIKVDCEGTDHMVVQGAKRLFDENRRLFATVEFFANRAAQTGESPREVLEAYEGLGFSPYEVVPEIGLVQTTYEELAMRGERQPGEPVIFDFAVGRHVPRRLLAPKGLLERAGDVLEYVPKPIRPKIRRRDRRPPRRDLSQTDLSGGSLDPSKVIEVESDLGPLLLEKHAVLLTQVLLDTGTWDPTLAGLIRTTLRPGSTFVDAGANIGYFSVLASKLVGPTGRVFAIEPDPLNLLILRANLDRHDCSNTTVLPVAAWSERDELHMYRQPTEGAATRVGAEMPGESVPAIPLDDLVEGPIDYLKVDTELTDHRVVAGSERLIAQNPSMLVTVEFHPWHDTHNGESPMEVLAVYERLDLTPYDILDTGEAVKPTTYGQLASPTLPEGHISLDFALSRELPDRLLWRKGLLEKAGDMLEHLPEPIRPKIRRRDKQPSSQVE